jgi:NTE family protein
MPSSGGTQTKRVAIACQGGGSHTAFTAGVLKRLFAADALTNCEVVALSGTSGGAVCALLVWSAFVDRDSAQAGPRLEQFWNDNAANGPVDAMLNAWMLWAAELGNLGLMPTVSPYHSPASVIGADQFRQLLRQHVDFDRIDVNEARESPVLLLGAVDVLSGRFRVFNSHRERITADNVLASAAIPNLFRAVQLDDGAYWDGLFSQNPPVHDLLVAEPDELWVIQVNPQQRDGEPTTLAEIADRRNELAGNLSLYQELNFIETIDALLESGQLKSSGKYKQIVVRIIELSRSRLPGRLGATSKLDRDPQFLGDLMSHGHQQAEEFLAALAFETAWREGNLDRIMELFASEATIVSEPPFLRQGKHHGVSATRQFVDEQLSGTIRLDLTHKQVARERVTWALRLRQHGDVDSVGQAEAEFVAGKVTELRLGSHPSS